jgi:hypothetical protein
MTNKKKNKKYLSALFLSALVLGGGFLAMPLMSADDQLAQVQENIKFFEKNPERFLQTENLGLRAAFEDGGRDFANNFLEKEKNNLMDEGALEAALEAEDYESWKDILENLEGFPEDIGVISEEDFKVLASLHKLKVSEKDEEKD